MGCCETLKIPGDGGEDGADFVSHPVVEAVIDPFFVNVEEVGQCRSLGIEHGGAFGLRNGGERFPHAGLHRAEPLEKRPNGYLSNPSICPNSLSSVMLRIAEGIRLLS